MLNVFLSMIGVALALVASYSYVKLILSGEIKPHRITWGGWSLAGVLGLWASYAGGAKIGLLVSVVLTGLVVVIFLLSLSPRYGKPGGHKTDYIFGGLAALGLICWRIFHFSPGWAAAIAIICDAVFISFTIREAWLRPEQEDPTPWTTGAYAELFGILALGHYSFAAAAYPIYILLGNLVIAWILVTQNKKRISAKA